jgi:hypothetical protein
MMKRETIIFYQLKQTRITLKKRTHPISELQEPVPAVSAVACIEI